MIELTRRQCLYLFGAGLPAAPVNTLSERWRQMLAADCG
jgi:hypothetical protein